jgi:hypothetical protein
VNKEKGSNDQTILGPVEIQSTRSVNLHTCSRLKFNSVDHWPHKGTNYVVGNEVEEY